MDEIKYYHGSENAELCAGDILVPGNVCGKGECMESVYITPHPSLAMQYAGTDGCVYEVQPIGEAEEDFLDDDGKPISLTCDSAKIIRCVW